MYIFGHLLFWNPTPQIQDGRQLNMQIRCFFFFFFWFLFLGYPSILDTKYEAHTIFNKKKKSIFGADLPLSYETVKMLFGSITQELFVPSELWWYFWVPWRFNYKMHIIFFLKNCLDNFEIELRTCLSLVEGATPPLSSPEVVYSETETKVYAFTKWEVQKSEIKHPQNFTYLTI